METHGAERLSRIISILPFNEQELRKGLAGRSHEPSGQELADSAVLSKTSAYCFLQSGYAQRTQASQQSSSELRSWRRIAPTRGFHQ